jgi:hypothetical protein
MSIIQRAAPPSCMAWHPKKKILVICWEGKISSIALLHCIILFQLPLYFIGGEITLWNDNTKRLESAPSAHSVTVSSLAWSSNGTRLLSGDEVLIVFTIETLFILKSNYILEWNCYCMESRRQR